MKQKLFLLLMLVVALAACTKDDEHDDYMSAAPPTNPTESSTSSNNDSVKTNYEVGNFEGEWILDQQVISQPDTIFVQEFNKKYYVDFVIPEEIPILKALEALGMENAEYAPSDILSHFLRQSILSPQGISDNKTYYGLYFTAISGMNVGDYFIDMGGMKGGDLIPAIYGGLNYYLNNSKRESYIILSSDKQNVAIYDSETGLWTMKITIRQVCIEGVYFYDLPSPLVLLFVAKRRL